MTDMQFLNGDLENSSIQSLLRQCCIWKKAHSKALGFKSRKVSFIRKIVDICFYRREEKQYKEKADTDNLSSTEYEKGSAHLHFRVGFNFVKVAKKVLHTLAK